MSTLGNKTTGGFSTISKQSLTGDGGTSYTLSQSVNNENELEVYVNNTRQEPTTAYTAQGTTLTMTGAVNASDSFYVIFQGKAVISQEGIFGNSSTRFTSDNVTIGGTLGVTGATTLSNTLAVTGDVSVDTDTLKVDTTNDKVGINTASPNDYYSDELVVTAADEGGMTIVTGTTHANYINFADGTSGNAAYRGFLKYDHNNDNMSLGTSAATAMTIDANGLIGIGTPISGYRFAITTNGSVEYQAIFKSTNTSGTQYHLGFNRDTTQAGHLTSNANNQVALNNGSDYRLKENISDMTDGIERVKQLQPKKFSFLSNPDKEIVDGFLAHEVKDLVPYSVLGEKDAVDKDGEPVMQTIDITALIPVLTGAIKELIAKVETLETEVKALKGE